jgi:hypothetical protein
VFQTEKLGEGAGSDCVIRAPVQVKSDVPRICVFSLFGAKDMRVSLERLMVKLQIGEGREAGCVVREAPEIFKVMELKDNLKGNPKGNSVGVLVECSGKHVSAIPEQCTYLASTNLPGVWGIPEISLDPRLDEVQVNLWTRVRGCLVCV